MKVGTSSRARVARLAAALLAVAANGGVAAATSGQAADDLTNLSLEDLLQVQVTSVSKKQERLFDAPAAVYVITQDEIHRAGVTSLPEALRLAPGVQVARIANDTWAVSVRGFNLRFSNKLLVLVDGRSVYSPWFSGVFWNMQDYVLEDIDRIEVIRGPGASIWGANAVNGVINIITKNSADTQGGLLTGGTGTEERGFGSLRYGGKINADTTYRVYAKGFTRDDLTTTTGAAAHDDWFGGRTGFRLDYDDKTRDRYSVQGEVRRDRGEGVLNRPVGVAPYTLAQSNPLSTYGGHVLGKWDRRWSPEHETSFQAYYEYEHITGFSMVVGRDAGDVDFQHRYHPAGSRHDFQWGLSLRVTSDDMVSTEAGTFQSIGAFNQLARVPNRRRTDMLYTAFAQDQIAVLANWSLTLGTKLEHNDYSGVEVQPTARLLWNATETTSAWLAVSKAVRTPARGESDASVTFGARPPNPLAPFPLSMLPTEIAMTGSRRFDSETLVAYETGVRTQWTPRLSSDLAVFVNKYHRLQSLDPGQVMVDLTAPIPHLIVPLVPQNHGEATTEGLELSADFRALDWWRLYGSYSYLHSSYSGTTNSQDPDHQLTLRSQMDLPHATSFDLWLRYVDALPALKGVANSAVPSYVTLDARLAWQPTPRLELAVTGQNLLDDRHPEFISTFLPGPAAEVPRGVYAQVQFKF